MNRLALTLIIGAMLFGLVSMCREAHRQMTTPWETQIITWGELHKEGR